MLFNCVVFQQLSLDLVAEGLAISYGCLQAKVASCVRHVIAEKGEEVIDDIEIDLSGFGLGDTEKKPSTSLKSPSEDELEGIPGMFFNVNLC